MAVNAKGPGWIHEVQQAAGHRLGRSRSTASFPTRWWNWLRVWT